MHLFSSSFPLILLMSRPRNLVLFPLPVMMPAPVLTNPTMRKTSVQGSGELCQHFTSASCAPSAMSAVFQPHDVKRHHSSLLHVRDTIISYRSIESAAQIRVALGRAWDVAVFTGQFVDLLTDQPLPLHGYASTAKRSVHVCRPKCSDNCLPETNKAIRTLTGTSRGISATIIFNLSFSG